MFEKREQKYNTYQKCNSQVKKNSINVHKRQNRMRETSEV
jgi:hypothetical protein